MSWWLVFWSILIGLDFGCWALFLMERWAIRRASQLRDEECDCDYHRNGGYNAQEGEPVTPDPDPLPQRTPLWAWVPYGTRGDQVHRQCAANRQHACTFCAPIVGRPAEPSQP